MAGLFEPAPDGGAAVALDGVEISILRSLTVQFLELVGPGEEPEGASDDPLARLLAEGPSRPPSDPALARLFPDAYGTGDDESRAASAEFRRYTENDLRARKREDALTVVRTLDRVGGGREGGVVRLAAQECGHWLGTLNDLRITLGSRLGITDDDDDVQLLPDSDPRKPLAMAYLWLGGLQETLLDVLMG